MDFKEIKRLAELMSANGLTEVEIDDQAKRVVLKRGVGCAPQMVVSAPMTAAPVAAAPVAPAAPPPAVADNLDAIKTPVVGTFYHASTPEAAPFVKVGDKVTPDTTVCIIEAMKVMNEIKAEKSGIIREICVENGDAVEFGQVLFKIEKA